MRCDGWPMSSASVGLLGLDQIVRGRRAMHTAVPSPRSLMQPLPQQHTRQRVAGG